MSNPTGPDQGQERGQGLGEDLGVARFQPDEILATLERHAVEFVVVGGYAAQLHGAARPTRDIDVTPRTTADNLRRLATALNEMGVRVRTEDVPHGLPYSASGESLTGVRMLNLLTDYGEVDLMVHPAGFEGGWDDLQANAQTRQLGPVSVKIAALDDVITSKERAGRGKDRAALPELYALAGRLSVHGRDLPESQETPSRGRSAQQRSSRGSPAEPLSARERIEQARRQAQELRRDQPRPPDQGYER